MTLARGRGRQPLATVATLWGIQLFADPSGSLGILPDFSGFFWILRDPAEFLADFQIAIWKNLTISVEENEDSSGFFRILS